jgi:hypothetical protein
VECPPQEGMNKPEYFEMMEGYAVFRPTGQVSLEQAVQLVLSTLDFACENHIEKLLVITTDLAPIEPPNLATRYFFVQDWAHAAQGKVCVAMVARPEVIDFQKIGTIVAENAGFRCNVFASEGEALAWLQNVKLVAQDEKIVFSGR